MFCLGAALFGGMILMPLYWQQMRLESVVDTGLLTAPMGLGMAVVMPIAGRLDRPSRRRAARARRRPRDHARDDPVRRSIGAHTSIVWLSVAMVVRGMGVGFAFMPAMAAAFAALDRSELADATPQLNVLQRVGGSIGTAVLAVVLAARARSARTALERRRGAYGTAFWWSLGLTAVAIVPCLVLMRAERAARPSRSSPRRRRAARARPPRERHERTAAQPAAAAASRRSRSSAPRSRARWRRSGACAGATPSAPAS